MSLNYRLIGGDAAKILPNLPSNSFDFIVLDPPYLFGGMPHIRKTALESVSAEKVNFKTLFEECSRLLKNNTTLALFGLLSTIVNLSTIITSSGFKYGMELVWVKPAPVNFLQAKRKPLNRHELIYLCSKGKIRFNLEESLLVGKKYIKRGVKFSRLHDIPRQNILTTNTGFRYMTSVLEAPSKPQMIRSEKTTHPTQKPLSLITQLVKAFTFEGDNVLDPFGGSGTTMEACQNTGRSCTTIELNPDYINIIRRRIEGKILLNQKTELTIESTL